MANKTAQYSHKTEKEWKPPISETRNESERTVGSYMPMTYFSTHHNAVGKLVGKMTITFPCSIEQEQESVFVGRALALRGCVTQGTTREETKRNLKSAIADVLLAHQKMGTQPQLREPEEEIEPSTLVNIHVEVNVSNS